MVCLVWKTTLGALHHRRILRLWSHFLHDSLHPPCGIPVISTGQKHDNTGTKVGSWRLEGAGVNLIYLL